MFIALPPREAELQLLIISMLASLPILVLLLCSPQMTVQNCIVTDGVLINGLLQSTASAHTTLHAVCVAFTTVAFFMGLLLDAASGRRYKFTALVGVVYCNNVVLIAAVIKFFSRNTLGGGKLINGRLYEEAVFDNSALLCAFYAVTVLSVLHVARWLLFGWIMLFRCREMIQFAATAVVVTTLYVVALILAATVIPDNGLVMFRNASFALCKTTDSVWKKVHLHL